MRQLHLIPTVIHEIFLVSNSPKSAYWKLQIVEHLDNYWIVKESGINGGDTPLDIRKWQAKSFDDARVTFESKVKQKLNPSRPSPRRYKLKGKK